MGHLITLPTWSAELVTDNATGDAFGRLRVADPHTIFDSKQILDNQPYFWESTLESGAGITAAWDQNEAATTITSTVSTAGLFTRRTRQRFNYQPGKSQLMFLTGNLAPTLGVTGVTRRIGAFDDNNGLMFAEIDGVVSVIQRSKVSGSVVDSAIAQTAWNIDKLDGTGSSGITVDWTKSQILVIDFEWLSVGRTRFGVVVDGVTCFCHHFDNANTKTGAYMSTPNLPLTYQLETTAAAPAAELVHICASVISEGGSMAKLGISRYVSTAGTHLDLAAADTLYPVIGVRLKSTHLEGIVNISGLSVMSATNDDIEWILTYNPNLTGGTPSFTAVENSSIEWALGNGTITVDSMTGGRQVIGGFAAAQSASSQGVTEQRHLGALVDGTRDEVWLCVRPLSANLDVEAALTFFEVA